MDVRVRERLVGALVLVAVIVLLVPAVLKGPGPGREPAAATSTPRVEIDLGDAKGTADNDSLVPEPEIAQVNPEGVPAETPAETPAIASPDPSPAESAGSTAAAPAPLAQAGPPAAEPTAWAVQLGAFSSRSKAEGLVTKLRSRGYAAFVLEYRAGGQLLHRVRVGPEQDRERAVAIAERLRKDGYQPVVAPHP